MRSPAAKVVRRTAGPLLPVAAGVLLLTGPVAAQEPSGRSVTGQLPFVGDREIFQPGTQPCTVPGYPPSCFHTDQTDEFDRKFHPAQGELSKVPPLDDLDPRLNALRAAESPVATDGTSLPRVELVCANCHGNYPDGTAFDAPTADYAPYDTWQATMMAQAWRDPLARAALAVANHGLTNARIDYSRGVYSPTGETGRTAGDACIRCHSPVGWLEGNSLPADGSRVHGKQMDGVQCDFCHRMVNPLTHTAEVPSFYQFLQNLPDSLLDPDTSEMGVGILQNGTFIVNTTGAKIGPYDDPVNIDQHPLDACAPDSEDEECDAPTEAPADPRMAQAFETASAENIHFMRNSQVCAVCHNVTNPVLNRVHRDGTVVRNEEGFGVRMPVERTYTEWFHSDCGPVDRGEPNEPLRPHQTPATPTGVRGCREAGEPVHRSCQNCHMPEVEGFAADPNLPGVAEKGRRSVRQHLFVGGNAWVQDMIPLFFPDQLPLQPAFDRVQALAVDMLQSAADVTLDWNPGTGRLRVDVENLTGHKLPTGYPEGRRMWLSVVGYDGAGNVVYESGAYDDATAVLQQDDDLKVWEAKLGILKPGDVEPTPSFHFILNNVILKDNRIAPAGFEVARAAKEQAVIVRRDRDCFGYDAAFPDTATAACRAFDFDGGAVAESHGKDVVFYDLSEVESVQAVKVTLRYQTASREYVEFLSDPANSGDYFDRFTAGLRAAWALTGKSAPVDMDCAASGDVPEACTS